MSEKCPNIENTKSSDDEQSDSNPKFTYGCDCDADCGQPRYDHQKFHDCHTIDRLFESLDLEILQHLFNKWQYYASATTAIEENGFSIKIHMKKKTDIIQPKPVYSTNLNPDNSSSEEENYIDADTLMLVPKPDPKLRTKFIPKEPNEDKKAIKKYASHIKKSLTSGDTLVCKRYRSTTKVNANIKLARYECPYENCAKSFTRLSDLKDHENRLHLKNQNTICTWPDCEKVFSCNRSMRRHIFRLHQDVLRGGSNDDDQICNFCSKTQFLVF